MIRKFKGKHRFLSNFWSVEIEYKGKVYPTLEHAYQAAKTLEESWRERIRGAESAGKAKKLGRRAPQREDWETLKIPVMRTLLQLKFAPDTALARQLLDTGREELVEGNTWGDKFWGVCNGEGQNKLGELLMEVRDDLKSGYTE